jgi:hypothetical protein
MSLNMGPLARWISLYFICCIGCSPTNNDSKSRLSFTLPESVQHKVDSAQTSNLKACFAVSVKGDGIPQQDSGQCDISYGNFSGLALLGQSIELEVPFGKNRRIDIFYVLSESNCEPFDISKGLGKTFGGDRVHLLGSAEGVDTDQSEVVVQVDVDWPSTANTLSEKFELPQTCNKGRPTINPLSKHHARVVQGAAFGQGPDGTEYHIRVIDQKLKIKVPDSWSGHLLPARLGEEK